MKIKQNQTIFLVVLITAAIIFSSTSQIGENSEISNGELNTGMAIQSTSSQEPKCPDDTELNADAMGQGKGTKHSYDDAVRSCCEVNLPKDGSKDCTSYCTKDEENCKGSSAAKGTCMANNWVSFNGRLYNLDEMEDEDVEKLLGKKGRWTVSCSGSFDCSCSYKEPTSASYNSQQAYNWWLIIS